LKAESDSDISIGGPTLAAAAIAAGLVEEYQLFVAPVIVGGGLKAFSDGVREDVELLGERRFEAGFVYLNYRSRR
jgi:riboflavin biosynthesis pyrimidine reductase